MRIGIFGGSFDPVHNAHLALARLALTELRLDELLWVPAGQPWQKDRVITPAVQREAMLRLAIEGEPRFAVSRLETSRSGPSYSVDTVRALQAQRPDVSWHLVIGQDQYAGFHTWHGWQELLGLVTLAVAQRAPPDLPLRVRPPEGVESTRERPFVDSRAAHRAAASLGADAPLNADPQLLRVPHATVALPMMDVSSTEIRARIARGQDIHDLVPAPVARYIARHHLYQQTPPTPAQELNGHS